MRRQLPVCCVDLGRWLQLAAQFLALLLVYSIVVNAGVMLAQQSSENQNKLPPGWVNPSDPNVDDHTIFLTYDRINQNRLLAKVLADEKQRLANERAEFLREVEERLGQLREHFEEANALRLILDQKGLSTADQRRAQGEFQESLGKVEEVARDLRERLVPVIPGMESEKDLQIQKDSDEMDMMDQQIEIAVNQFRRQPGQIMQWPGEETILVCLHWVEEIARTVREGN